MATGRVPTTANSPLTAKGDLFTYSTTQARLAVGNNGDTLLADSSTSTGLRWQVPVNVNPVLNSAMQVWQRGTSFAYAATAIYTADRWYTDGTGSNRTISRQLTNDTTNLPFIQYCTRIARDSGNATTNSMNFYQPFETINSVPFAGKTVTLSFYARAGANFSATSSAITVQLKTGTGTDQNVRSTGYTGEATPINSTATLTTTWQRFTYTATLASTVTELGPLFNIGWSGTAGAADYAEITGVQLEVGSVATPFKTNGATLQGELAACQRYYYRFNGSASSFYIVTGYASSATVAYGIVWHPTTMRVNPSFSAAAAANFAGLGSGGATATAVSGSNLSVDTFVYAHTQASGLTTGGGLIFYAGSAGYFELSAEL
jgi:hypothetical protein